MVVAPVQRHARHIRHTSRDRGGEDLSLGSALHERHVSTAAAFGASIGVDEYDYAGEE